MADRPIEDLTARARIVDAALAQFTAGGMSGATMRSVAETAGVSIGLVQHHFGTKAGLRRACDERVLSVVRTKADNVDGLTDPGFLGGLYAMATPVMAYVARIALERDEQAADLFDAVTAVTAEWFSKEWPERYPSGAARTRDVAAATTAMGFGTLALHHQLARRMGLSPDEPVPSPRVGLAAVDVYMAMGEFLSTSFGEDLRRTIDSLFDPGTGHHGVHAP